MEEVARWMETHHLELAPQKTEAVLLIGRKRCQPLTGLALRGFAVETKKEVKYLGVVLDQGLTSAPQIQYALDKARKAVAGLSRIMPRTHGASEGKRRLLASVASSIALYGAPVWADALKRKTNVKKMASVQRLMAIRICRAYCTAETQAVLVIARQTPWQLLAEERTRRHGGRTEPDREETMHTGGQRTKGLIPCGKP